MTWSGVHCCPLLRYHRHPFPRQHPPILDQHHPGLSLPHCCRRRRSSCGQTTILPELQSHRRNVRDFILSICFYRSAWEQSRQGWPNRLQRLDWDFEEHLYGDEVDLGTEHCTLVRSERPGFLDHALMMTASILFTFSVICSVCLWRRSKQLAPKSQV